MATTRKEDTSRRGRSPPATIKEVNNVSRARPSSRSPSSVSRSSSGKAVHVDTNPSGNNRKPALRLSPETNNNRKKTTTNTQGTTTGRNLTRNRSMDKPPPSPPSASQSTRISQTTVKDRTLLKSSTFSPSKSVVGIPVKSLGTKTQQVISSSRVRSGSGNAVKKGGASGVTMHKEGSTRMIIPETKVIVPVAEEEEMVIGEPEQDLLDSTQLEYHILEELPDPERKDENNPKTCELEADVKAQEETHQIPNEQPEEFDAENGERANMEEPKVKDVEIVTVSKKQGKEATAYNDVIGETASKLMEKRKSKVLALVGAFETVISLQESETPTRLSRPPTPQGVNKQQLPIVTGNNNQTTTTATDILTDVHDGDVTDESEIGGTESTKEDLE